MPYSMFVIVALVTHIIINLNYFSKKDAFPYVKTYRAFLIVVAIFYLADIFWGVFYEQKMSVAVYIDTTVYFVMMGATILLWTQFVTKYLEDKTVIAKVLLGIGFTFFAAEIVLLIINAIQPILFRVIGDCEYEAYPARHVMLWVQIGMYALVAIYSKSSS